ncbi:diguanylate cyclase [Brevibacillus gelatini]|uniref:Sensor domain-containing diguanylate cyclase n=1 Tax=Brevibacillus gelatini TaxID=1655277 RepID=A0A3M8BDF5_9BACL|nr:sensor domain-containing diguanylate cyclase [Brevibacillus gelatini]RNB61459.1 sensor domain-containing diguanylate cyclase [Brevibacillus gelatini]
MAKLDITTIISQHSNILTSLFHHMSDMFFLMAVEKNANGDYQFRYVLMNPAAMKGANLGEDTYGKLIEEVYPPDKADLLNSMYRQTVEDASPTHFTTKGDMIGESILSPVFNSDGVCTHVFSVTRDITERKKLEWQLEYMAYHDVLTGLPNRRLLYENLQQSLEKAKESGEMVAALYLDCDHFKQINDTLGHDAGDTFLQMLAQRLQACVREQDMVARLGGDEFVVILTGIQNERQAEKVATRILHSLQQPWSFRGQTFSVTSSIGIALYPVSASEADQLLSNADKALYKAKETGRNQFFFFDPAQN